MFTKVKLTNFRKHTDRTFDFTQGLNVIRGPNESAKSTVLEAITYALFGANSLRESLEKTVTWEQKEATLKVELEFTINGQVYRITRSKAGAELFCGTNLTVTGQREVTKYCEALLGTSADAATKLMMANQTSLRGALQDGPAAAVTLIENLANFDLIDSIVGLVQEKLPSGNTIALQSQIETLDVQLAEPLLDERAASQAVLRAAQSAAAAATQAAAADKVEVDSLRPSREAAQYLRQDLQAAEANVERAQANKTLADSRCSDMPEPVDISSIAALERTVKENGEREVVQRLYNQLAALKNGDEWEGDADTLAREVEKTASAKQALLAQEALLKAEIADQRVAYTSAKAKLITATHCAFCDKDLSDVPEVTTFNATWTPKIIAAELAVTKATTELTAVSSRLAELTSDLKDFATIQNVAASRAALYQKAAAYINLDETFVPARWSWTGTDLSRAIDANAAQKLTALRAQVTAYERDLGRAQMASEQAQAASKALTEALAALTPYVAAAAGCEAVFRAYDVAVVAYSHSQAEQTARSQALQQAVQAANYAEKLHSIKLDSRKKLAEQRDLAIETLKSTVFNNALLKKLRTAKPQVANKLWAIVLGTVSKTFSQIRGQASVVTRGAEGFMVDGRSVGGLSGSTLDALGLAIRIALTKTFLPNTRFMVLDESSAACDQEREAAMVGTVVSADFDQVIWVSHSDGVESFASNVIQI